MEEREFKIQASEALRWYRTCHKKEFTLEKIGKTLNLDNSTISKNLSYTYNDNFKEKSLISLQRALEIAEAMNSNLWTIMYQYELYKENEVEKNCTSLNHKDNLKSKFDKFESLIMDANDSRFNSWIGEYYCYFSSTSSQEIDVKKRENPENLQEGEERLYNITPSNDHIFCGIMNISKDEDGLCKVLLTFMADKSSHSIKHYSGILCLSSQYAAGFIEMACQENGECSYIIVNSPDSSSMKCRMAMALTLSSIDGHRRPCAEKILISKNEILERTIEYEALKAFLPMNDSVIHIHKDKYKQLIEELKSGSSDELRDFAEKNSDIAKLAAANSTIEMHEYVSIHESIISGLKNLSDEDKNQLRVSMRKYSIANWYYKANNKNAEDILNIIEKRKRNRF